MCFSATASFGSSAVLLTIGLAAEKKATTGVQRFFGCIPLFFCVQQFTEGCLWLGFSNTAFEFFVRPLSFIFLLFAQVIWPVMIPLSMALIEKHARRKTILFIFTGSGLFAGAYMLYCMYAYTPEVSVSCYHIDYRQYIPEVAMKYGGVFYLVPVALSPFVSGNKKMWLLGAVEIISYIITQIFYAEYMASVWCFFAAIISVIILWVIIDLNKVTGSRPAINK